MDGYHIMGLTLLYGLGGWSQEFHGTAPCWLFSFSCAALIAKAAQTQIVQIPQGICVETCGTMPLSHRDVDVLVCQLAMLNAPKVP